jgi:peptidoglycan/xylan/chitin deacetylase (PgdA/CDA1 family)
MTLPADYLTYPYRRPGMDHDRYAYSNLFTRREIEWPGGARVALWIVPALEFFPLDMTGKPFMAPGGMGRGSPDYWNYTLRDYGNRVGVFRIFEALDERGLKASVPMSSRLAERYPFLLNEVTRRGWEVVGHGVDMGRLHHGGQSVDDERALVQESLATLRKRSGQRVTGWLSPAYSESMNTLDLVAAEGVQYVCDWVMDDLPVPLQTKGGTIHALPHAWETSDLQLVLNYRHDAGEFAQQVCDYFDTIYQEAGRAGARVLALSVRPWLMGVPHRIAAFERVLDHVTRHAGVWSATGAEIMEAFRSQT